MNTNPFIKFLKSFNPEKVNDCLVLEQRYVDLYATYKKLQLSEEQQRTHEAIIQHIESLFELTKTWDNSNLIEQF